MDFIIIILISFRSILPVSFIGNVVHQPEYVANPTFPLSSVRLWQMYVKKIIWMKLAIMWQRKMSLFNVGMSACTHENYLKLINTRMLDVFVGKKVEILPKVSRTCRSTSASWTPPRGWGSETWKPARVYCKIRSTTDAFECTFSKLRGTPSCKPWRSSFARRWQTRSSIFLAASCEIGRGRAGSVCIGRSRCIRTRSQFVLRPITVRNVYNSLNNCIFEYRIFV